MTATNQIGPHLTLSRVKRATLAHVQAWLPTYLRDVERAEGVRADGATPLVPGSLPLPRSWRVTDGPVHKWPEDQLPAVIFGSPGLDDSGPRRRGDGEHSGRWVVSLTAVVAGRDADVTDWLVGLYTAALRLLMVQQPLVAGLDMEGVTWQDEAYDDLPAQRTRSLKAGTCTFTMQLGGLASSAFGPVAPLPDPTTDPGPYPTVQDTGMTVERRPLA